MLLGFDTTAIGSSCEFFIVHKNACSWNRSILWILIKFPLMIFWNWIDDPRVLIASPASIFLQRKYLKPVSRISTASALDLDQHQIWSLHAWLPQSLTRVLLRQVANTGQHFRPSIAPGLQRTWVQWNPVRAADWKFGPQFTDREKMLSVDLWNLMEFVISKLSQKKFQVVTCNQQGLASLGSGLPLPISR